MSAGEVDYKLAEYVSNEHVIWMIICETLIITMIIVVISEVN